MDNKILSSFSHEISVTTDKALFKSMVFILQEAKYHPVQQYNPTNLYISKHTDVAGINKQTKIILK